MSEKVTLLAQCQHELPGSEWSLGNAEERYTHRYLDLLTNSDTRQRLITRYIPCGFAQVLCILTELAMRHSESVSIYIVLLVPSI